MFKANTSFDMPIQFYLLILYLPILGLSLIKSLKVMTPFSLLANIFIMVPIAYVLYVVCQDLPPISKRTLVADLSTQPLFLGTVIFANEAIAIVIILIDL